MAELGTWYDAASLTEAAELAVRLLDDDALVDVRPSGVRAWTGVVSPPLRVVTESASPAGVASWWAPLLDDPLLREAPVSFRGSGDDRPLRNRWHLDVVRPAPVVERLGLGPGSGPYGVRHVDPDGNEVDLLPGGPLAVAPDWQEVFSAIACYRVSSGAQQRALVTEAAAVAGGAGFPLLVDVRPGVVVLDTGKDQADAGAHGLDVDFGALAASLQDVARDLGAVADTSLPVFTQLVLDAADVTSVRAFWLAALGYVRDPRDGVTDIVDPRRLGPVLVLQELDAADLDDAARRSQRNRTHLELHLPADTAAARVDASVGAGGRVLDSSGGSWRVADPEGNELVVIAT